MNEKTLLEAITKIIDEKFATQNKQINDRFSKIDDRFNKIDDRFNKIDEQLIEIKEDTMITRSAVNSLIEWAEEVSVITQVKFPIKKAE